MMRGITEVLAASLGANERDAVLGDLAEFQRTTTLAGGGLLWETESVVDLSLQGREMFGWTEPRLPAGDCGFLHVGLGDGQHSLPPFGIGP